jgi:hypothetical protein
MVAGADKNFGLVGFGPGLIKPFFQVVQIKGDKINDGSAFNADPLAFF